MAKTVDVFGTPVDFPDDASQEQIEGYLNSSAFLVDLSKANPEAYSKVQTEQQQTFASEQADGAMAQAGQGGVKPLAANGFDESEPWKFAGSIEDKGTPQQVMGVSGGRSPFRSDDDPVHSVDYVYGRLKKGTANIGSAMAGVVEGVGNAVGSDAVESAGSSAQGYFEEITKDVDARIGKTQDFILSDDSLWQKYQRGEDIELQDFGKAVLDLALEQAPQLVMGGIAAKLGRVALSGTLQKFILDSPKIMAPLLAKYGAKGVEMAANLAASGLGTAAAMSLQETGSIYNEQKGEKSFGRAALFGVPAGISEAAGMAFGLSKAGLGGIVGAEMGNSAKRGIGKLALDTLMVTPAVEAGQEGFQTVLEQIGQQTGKGVVDSVQGIDWKQVGEASIGGGVIGTFGAPVAPITNAGAMTQEQIDAQNQDDAAEYERTKYGPVPPGGTGVPPGGGTAPATKPVSPNAGALEKAVSLADNDAWVGVPVEEEAVVTDAAAVTPVVTTQSGDDSVFTANQPLVDVQPVDVPIVNQTAILNDSAPLVPPTVSETPLAPLAPLDDQAHVAATSPLNDIPQPTAAQIEAGNYKKGHVKLHGLDISIENPAGSLRSGVDPDGKAWETELNHHYGYLKGTIGRDKDHIDVFIGPNPDSQRVFIVDQVDPETGIFDEHKTLMGFDTLEEARQGYLSNFTEPADNRIGGIANLSVDKFKEWLKSGRTQQPYFGMKFKKGGDEYKVRAVKSDSGELVVDPWITAGQVAVKADNESFESSEVTDETGITTEDSDDSQAFSEETADRSSASGQDDVEATDDAGGFKQSVAVKGETKRLTIGGVQKQGGTAVGTGTLLDNFTADPQTDLFSQKSEEPTKPSQTTAHSPDRERFAQRYAELLGVDTVSDFHRSLVDAIMNKDAKGVRFIANGLNDKAKQLFTEVTGVALPKQQGKTWDAIMQWAEIDPQRQALDDAYLSAGRAWSQAAKRLEALKNGSDAVKHIDTLIDKGFTTYREVKVAANKINAYLVHPDNPASGHLLNPKGQPDAFKQYAQAASVYAAAEKALNDYQPQAAAENGAGGVKAETAIVEAKAETEPVTADGKIEDFGEKIGGARKDTAERGFSMSGKKKTDNGAEPWRKKYVAMEKIDGSGWTIGKRDDKYSLSGRRGMTFATQEEAEAAIPAIAIAEKHSAIPNSDKTYSIWKQTGERKRIKVVNRDFPSREDALRYMVEHAVDLMNLKTSFGEEILPTPEIAIRTGVDYRKGEDATPEMFVETFGPRGIEFGNWNNQEERKQVMNHAFDGLMDLSRVTGLPPKALMLNGELAIAFGARGQGLSGAKAHYERDYSVINLTKMSGAGSMGHEWLHAVDHYLARLDSKAKTEKEKNKRGDMVYPEQSLRLDMQSHGYSTKSKLRLELRDAYQKLMEEMFKKAEQYVEDSTKADVFVSTTRENLRDRLNDIRNDLAADNTRYAKSQGGYRKSEKGLKPAAAEQLAAFDRLATILLEGGDLGTEYRYNMPEEKPEDGKKPAGMKRAAFGRLMAGRWSNDTLDAINALYKTVRNRSAFNKEHGGPLDSVRAAMNRYAERLKMFEDAQSGTEKTKMVPTSYLMEARKMDQARTSDYWSEPHEMAARAFAAYVEDKIAEQGGQSEFLVYHAHGGILLPMIDGFIARPYPEGKERIAINQAFDKFLATIQTKETEKGIAIFETAESYDAFSGDSGIMSIGTVKEANSVQLDLFGSETVSGKTDSAGTGKRTASGKRAGVQWYKNSAFPANVRNVTSDTEAQATGTFTTSLKKVKNSADAAAFFTHIAESSVEKFMMLALDKNKRPLALIDVSTGTLNQSLVHPRNVIGVALNHADVDSIWLGHNHPSGDPTRSPEDVQITERLIDAARGSGLTINGHVIMGTENSYAAIDEYIGGTATESGKGTEVPVLSSRFTKRPGMESARISGEEQLRQVLQDLGLLRSSGVMLFNSKNIAIGNIEMSLDEMEMLRTGSRESGSGLLQRMISRLNAAAFIVYADAPIQSMRSAVDNMQNFGGVIGVRMLDGYSATDDLTFQNTGRMPVAGGTFYSNPMFDPVLIVRELAGVGKNIKAGSDALVRLGQRVIHEGADSYQKFAKGMKQYLGEQWERFKSLMMGVYQKAQAAYKASRLGDERGLVGVDINSEKGIIEGSREEKIKGGFYVPERLPSEYGRERQKGALGTATRISGRVHEAVRRREISGGNAWEKQQRYKELAENLRTQEAAALQEWATADKLIISPDDFVRQWTVQGKKGGAEHRVYLNKDGSRVFKYNLLNQAFHETFLDYLNRLVVHNVEFPGTAYTFEGLVEIDGRWLPVVSQPWIRGRKATFAESHDNMVKRGYEPVGTAAHPSSYRIPGTGILVRDVHGDNSRVDAQGNIYVIDPVIEFDLETKRERLAKEVNLEQLPESAGDAVVFGDEVDAAVEEWSKSARFSLAYHGSPHDHDGFDMSKIGTGEGAQVYGYGLYFAGNKEVAEWYRDNVRKESASELGRIIKEYSPDAYNKLDKATRTNLFYGTGDTAIGYLIQNINTAGTHSALGEDWKSVSDAIKSMPGGGKLYHVELAPAEDEYLLWDKPLSEQSEKVQAALKDYNSVSQYKVKNESGDTGESYVVYRDGVIWVDFETEKEATQYVEDRKGDQLGSQIHESVKADNDYDAQAASEYLHSLGIRGIKYLDGVSRNRPLREIKAEFLGELPENATFEDVEGLFGTGKFSPKNEALLKALAADDWLGFDYPAQAVSAALGKDLNGYDPSPQLLETIAAVQEGGTYNYVIFNDADVAIKAKYMFGSGAGVKRSAVETVIEPLRKNWRNAPPIEVVQSESELPQNLRSEIQSLGVSGAVRGVFDAGRVFLVADNLNSDPEAVRVLLHEVVGHYGLAGMLGKEFDYVLGQVALSVGNKGLRRIAERYGFDLSVKEERLAAAAEKLAEMAERGENPKLLGRAIAAVRAWLRDMGVDLEWSDNDILALLARAKGWVTNGKETVLSNDSTAAQAEAQAAADTAAGAGDRFATAPWEDDAAVQFSLKPDEQADAVAELINFVPDKLADAVAPLGYRTRKGLDYVTSSEFKEAVGWFFRNPFFQAEADPLKQPFYSAGSERETNRMAVMLSMFGWEPGSIKERTKLEKVKDFLFTWQSGDKVLRWEQLKDVLNKLEPAQRKAFDLLFTQGDIGGIDYSTLARAKMNPRIRRADPSAETFALYKKVRSYIDVDVEKVITSSIESFLRDAGMEESDVRQHISDYRKHKASRIGWLTRDHGDGDIAVRVYRNVKELRFETRSYEDDDGNVAGEQALLALYPGKEVEAKLRALAGKHKVTVVDTAPGGMIFTKKGSSDQVDEMGYAGALRQFQEDAALIIPESVRKNGVYPRVLVYAHYVATDWAADKLKKQIEADYAKAMPHNYRQGEEYFIPKPEKTDKLSESMFADMRSDMAVEAALTKAMNDAFKRGEISKDDATAYKDSLIRNTAEVLLGRAAGKYQIRRAPYLIEGYQADSVMDLYQDYMTGVAGQITKAAYAREQFELYQAASNSVKTWAERYIKDSLRNMGRLDRISGNIRALAALWYMGFKVSTVMINLSQPLTIGFAELGRYTRWPLAKIMRAQRDVIAGKLTSEEKAIFQTAIYQVQEMETAMGELSGHSDGYYEGASRGLNLATGKALALFQHAEILNRKTMILAAYRVFRNKGMADLAALDKALTVNSSVNFDMGRHNLPGWARNPVGRTFYALQSFGWNSFNYIYNRGTSGEKEQMIALMRYMGMLLLLGGLGGWPLLDEFDKAYRKLRGYSFLFELKSFMKKQGKQFGSLGDSLNAFIWHGLPALAGVNVSNSMRLQMPIVSNMLNDNTLVESAMGVSGGLIDKMVLGITYAGRGQTYRAAEAFAPEAVAGGMRAYRMSTEGVTTSHGKMVFHEGKPMKLTEGEAALRVLGFQPMRPSAASAEMNTGRKLQSFWKRERDDAIDEYRATKRLKPVQDFNIRLKQSQAAGLVDPISSDTMRRANQSKANKKKTQWEQRY